MDSIQSEVIAAKPTHWSQYAVCLSQGLAHVVHRAEHQGTDYNIYRVVLHCPQVLPRRHHKSLISQVIVLGHSFCQIFLKVRVGVGTDQSATRRIKLKICTCAAANLQNCELPASLLELWQNAKQILLFIVHLLIVRFRHPIYTNWENTLVYSVQADGVNQVKRNA